MSLELNPLETRVIGCLIEKRITSPDQYPLSLNALTNAVNQKSNRDPVLSVDESAVQEVVDGLRRQHLIGERTGFGSRVPKYAQLFCNNQLGGLQYSEQELAVMCELMLRGPQTPGELRQRAGRLATFDSVAEVEAVLQGLQTRDDGPFVARLPRQPGRRDSRFAHLLSGAVEAADESEPYEPSATPAGTGSRSTRDRLDQLEQQVAELRQELDQLKALLE